MGGIKNKLTSKAKTLLNSLPLAGEMPVAFRVGAHLASQKCDDKRADEMTKSSQSREGDNKTIPLSDYRLTSPFSQRGTKNAVNKGSLSLKGAGSPLGLAEGSLSTGLSLTILTKYLGIACLSLAILSTLVLNIISSYSNSSTRSKAEPVGNVSTLANDSACDPANTNAESCISLSITSSSSTSTGGNDPNLSLSIPQGGGIATGRHTVTVNSNNYTGYYVTLTGNAGSPAMTPTTSTSQAFIQSTTGTLTNPSPLDKGQWGSWGIALPNSSLYSGFNTNEADYNSTNQDVLTRTTWAAVPGREADDGSKTIIKTTTQSKKTDTYPVYYGVRVDSPVSVPADTYTAQVVYTATTNEVPVPKITNLSKDSYELGSGDSSQITISGTNLGSTYEVYLTNTNGDRVGECTNLNVIDDNNIFCTIPTTGIAAGDYTIHVVTQGGEASIPFTYTEPSLPTGVRQVTADYGSDGHVAVDFDEHMIPVKYAGNTTTPRWEVVTDAELESNPANWFSYTANKKQWANAVTVTESSLQEYLNAEKGSNQHYEVDNDDVLGYWVYIPRYAYEVMRRDATDRVVGPQEFDIRFETKGDVKKIPQKCTVNSNIKTAAQMWRNGTPTAEATSTNSNILAVDYRTSCGISRTYGAATGTTWATHPAFTFGSTELNGFWVGKFETTGKINSPTVKPNQQSNVAQLIGEFYTAAKSVGYPDPNNVGGNTVSGTVQNSHNMAYLNSSLARNREFGSVFMLIYSKHGRFQNGEIPNSLFNAAAKYGNNNQVQYDADGDEARYGTTGCGPISEEPGNTINYWFYEDGTYLSSSKIESETACSADTRRAYNGSLGVLASSTGNEYGVYDIVAGAGESAAGNLNQRAGVTTSSSEFSVPATYPYVDMYRNSVSDFAGKQGWSVGQTSNFYNVDSCTWELCGGTLTHEAGYYQSLDGVFQGWGNLLSFVDEDNPWVLRDSIAATGFHGVGALDNSNGSVPAPLSTTITYRISMIARY